MTEIEFKPKSETNVYRMSGLKPGHAYRIVDSGNNYSSFTGSVGIATGNQDTAETVKYFLVLAGEHLNPTQINLLITKDDECQFEEIDCKIIFG